MKLLEENKENICELGLGKDFLDTAPKAQYINGKNW